MRSQRFYSSESSFRTKKTTKHLTYITNLHNTERTRCFCNFVVHNLSHLSSSHRSWLGPEEGWIYKQTPDLHSYCRAVERSCSYSFSDYKFWLFITHSLPTETLHIYYAVRCCMIRTINLLSIFKPWFFRTGSSSSTLTSYICDLYECSFSSASLNVSVRLYKFLFLNPNCFLCWLKTRFDELNASGSCKASLLLISKQSTRFKSIFTFYFDKIFPKHCTEVLL